MRMEHKKSNHSWDEEEIKKYLEQSAEAEEIPPELETENMRKYIKTQTTGEQQKKHKNITGNIKRIRFCDAGCRKRSILGIKR